MDTAKIVQELDAEIARLTSARNILLGANSSARHKQPLRNSPTKKVASRKPGRLTAAGRKRLSELMKKRWAERKKKAASKAK